MFVKMNKIQQFRKAIFIQFIFFGSVFMANATNTLSQKPDSFSIEGRWDMTVHMSGREAPSWLEVRHSGLHTLVGFFVGSGGSVRPISRIYYEDNKLRFSLPPQWETATNDISFEGIAQGD